MIHNSLLTDSKRMKFLLLTHIRYNTPELVFDSYEETHSNVSEFFIILCSQTGRIHAAELPVLPKMSPINSMQSWIAMQILKID